ncbi:uncharacterized protein LOC128204200 isoform X2 [Mya arenaria]|uniref:uncharacterized protein LOC128204200 isoform X2 n=1 Tax=Mya arenaria TaxID=6604 RepID=UPI0022E6AEA4|nr:uncharacterized protein LOC128204200 isoform X2 [Mya arenaria]
MENYKKQFTKPEHQNWLKMSIALNITTRGLAPFACEICDDIRVKSLNIRIKHFFPDLCKNCSIVEVIPCDPNNNICNSGQCRFHKGRSFRPCLIVKCNDYRNTVTDLIRKGLDIEIICNSCRTAEIIPCNPRNKVCNSRRCRFHMDQHTRQIISSRPCPKFICNTLRDTIEQRHRFGSPSWRNTDARKWCVNAWEIAKCFMPPDGYADVDNEVDTDFNGIITVYINCVEFQQYFTDDLSRQRNICYKVRDIGKCVRHAPGLNISDWDLKLWLSDLKTLFADPIFNKNNPLAQDAIDQLDMLERDELLIQHSDIAEVLDIKNAFEELSSGLDKRASDIGDVVDDIIAPVKHDATDRAIQDTRELIEWKQDAIDDFNVITVEEALTKEPYYIIRFAVQVIKEEALQLFTKEGFLLCLMNDKTGSVWLLGYLQHGRPRAQIKYRSLLGRTFKHKLGNVSQSNCKEWQSFDVPQNILDAAMEIHQLGKKNFAQRDQADVKQQAITKSENPDFLADINLTEGFEVKAVQSEAGTMTQFMKKDVGTMTEHRDESSLTDSLKSDLLEPCVSVDDTSSAGSGKTDLSEPSVDFGKNDIHDEGAKRLTKDAVHESDDISPRDSVETYLSELSVDVGVDIHEEGAKRLSKHEVDESVTNSWNQSFRYGKKYIRSLIRKYLPPPDILNDLCYCYGRKSKIIKDMCEAVLLQIKETIEALPGCLDIVADIYPSYTIESENHIVFLVTLKEQVDTTLFKKYIPFATEYRVIGYYTTEAKSIYKSEIFTPMTARDQLKVKQCINMHSKDLFNKHRYLSIITANVVKSRGFKTNSHVQDKQLCIVLFVHAKGFVPIAEDPFFDAYDEIAIDVLEGVFIPYGNTSLEFHQDVKMGCKIMRNCDNGGTLGGFIDHHTHGLVGLTCAHALLHQKELESCLKHRANLRLSDWPTEYREKGKRHVFQPVEDPNRGPLGQIVEAVYCHGGENQSGVEAVLFRVESQFPLSGGFPSVKKHDAINDTLFSFGSGRICGPTALHGKEVAKFGAKTELTKGFVEFEESFICVKTIDFPWTVGSLQMVLFNQNQVRAIDGVFAYPGDSGALVFGYDFEEVVAIGMVEGGEIGSQITVVSPIGSILERFNTRKFKQFDNKDKENSNRMIRIEQKLDELSSLVKQHDDILQPKKKT